MLPSDFRVHPWASVFLKSECETIARNIMAILSRTGNAWRLLSYDEYVLERKKDGNFSTIEEKYFEMVVEYTHSPESAKMFSPTWKKIYNDLK